MLKLKPLDVSRNNLKTKIMGLKSFEEFETIVKHLCNPRDFKKNSEKLREIRISSYETFTTILRLGGEITTSIRASEEIFKMSTETTFTELEIIKMLNRCRFINGLIDSENKT